MDILLVYEVPIRCNSYEKFKTFNHKKMTFYDPQIFTLKTYLESLNWTYMKLWILGNFITIENYFFWIILGLKN